MRQISLGVPKVSIQIEPRMIRLVIVIGAVGIHFGGS
ncbi:Uncharacterised protein [Vibrio cholerae]|nr:Uncharacterised protein [Vibrio cholerae]